MRLIEYTSFEEALKVAEEKALEQSRQMVLCQVRDKIVVVQKHRTGGRNAMCFVNSSGCWGTLKGVRRSHLCKTR